MARRTETDQGQPSTRHPGTVTDHHGRKWGCSIDNRSGLPVGKIQPEGWRAPWIPPQDPRTYIFDLNDRSRFRINYEALLEERLQGAKEYDDGRQRAALVRGWDPSDPEKQDALDSLVGRRDGLQHPEVIVACMQGDKWMLGLTNVVNPKLERFIPKKVDRRTALLSKFPDFTVPDPELEDRLDLEDEFDPEATGTQRGRPSKPKGPTWNEFAAEQRKAGKTTSEISALWQELKEQNTGAAA